LIFQFYIVVFDVQLYTLLCFLFHYYSVFIARTAVLCFQCFDAVGWAAGRALACKKLSGGALAGARCRLAYGPADATATHCHLLH